MTRKYLKNDNISTMYKNINNIFIYIYIYIFLSSIPTKIYQRSSYWSIWGTRSPTCFWKWFKYPSAVNVKTQKGRKKKREKKRHVNKFKKHNLTKSPVFILCAILEYCRVWGGKPLQPASPVDKSLFEDGPSSPVQQRVPKVIFSSSSTYVRRFRHSSTTSDVGHRQNRRALFSYLSNPGMNPFWWVRGEGHSLDSGGGSGFSSLLVCQEFVSQLNPLSTQSSTNLTIIYTVYKLQSWTRETREIHP